jgi:hypothetical protein
MELKTGGDDGVQYAYAKWLRRGTFAGVVVLIGAFAAYVLGVVPHVPMEHLPALWEQPASRYLETSQLRPGWHWATLVHRSDMLVLAGIAFLATCSVVSLAAAIRAFGATGERAFMVICAVQILVLLLAASGLLAGGH